MNAVESFGEGGVKSCTTYCTSLGGVGDRHVTWSTAHIQAPLHREECFLWV